MRHAPSRIPLRIANVTAATLIALVALTTASGGGPDTPTTQPAETQWWKGAVTLPGSTLDFVVTFRPAAEPGQYRATIDIPVQGAKDLPLTDVSVTSAALHFTIAPPAGAVFSAKRSGDGKTAEGELNQRGMTLPLHMDRITEEEAKSVGPARPQTPAPPFPYLQRDVAYDNPKDGTHLAGTLTIPASPGPHPAVLLITGSGAQDRDETIFGHKPFLVIADYLTRKGIAVLRVDDRGVGGSTGKIADATTEDFAGDVRAGVDFLKKQPEIDPHRIGLVGHSEGALIAPMVAAKSDDIACIVMLAGAAFPGDKLLLMQSEALLRAAGASDEDIQRHTAAHRAVQELTMKGASDEEITPAVRELVRLQLTTNAGGNAPTAEALDKGVAVGLRQFRSPWLRWFLKHDPHDDLRHVKCPVLALGGSLDLQVPAKEDLAEIEKTLHAAGNQNATTKELPGLNHLFQQAKTGLVGEYATISQTFSPAALDEMATWLRKQFKLTGD